MESIFKVNENIEFANTLQSFKGCPNGCIDGYYVDPYEHIRKKCKYCEDKRRQLVKENLETKEGTDIYKALNLPRSFVGDVFNEESVIPDFAKKDIVPESISVVLNEMKSLYESASIGDIQGYSVLFNLGKRAFESNFVYPYMLRAYQAGVSVCPYLTDYDVRLLYDGEDSTIEGISYKDLIKFGVCVVMILAGASVQNIRAVKGLMEFRAHYDKVTMIVTNTWNKYIRELCTEDGVKSKSLACMFSVEYTEKFIEKEEKQKTNMSIGLTSKEFNNLLRK